MLQFIYMKIKYTKKLGTEVYLTTLSGAYRSRAGFNLTYFCSIERVTVV